jgi:hypothetical protein
MSVVQMALYALAALYVCGLAYSVASDYWSFKHALTMGVAGPVGSLLANLMNGEKTWDDYASGFVIAIAMATVGCLAGLGWRSAFGHSGDRR